MKHYSALLVSAALLVMSACNQKPAAQKQSSNVADSTADTTKVKYDDSREDLKLAIADTIKRTALFSFSDPQAKDTFCLMIEPGLVKKSKASLQIITAGGRVIYTQRFDAVYFIQGIFEPDSVPKTGGQEAYDKYMVDYRKSITPRQYEQYFRKNIDSFFNTIYPITRSSRESPKDWEGDDVDKAVLQEYLHDTTLRAFDISCYDCYEGGTVVVYSRKHKMAVKLLEHD